MAQLDTVGLALLLALLLVAVACLVEGACSAVQKDAHNTLSPICSAGKPRKNKRIFKEAKDADERYFTDSSTKSLEQISGTSSEPIASLFGNGRQPSALLHLKGKIFEWFKLPRELRDQIIDELLEHERILSRRQSTLRMTLADYVKENLLLVNRQFRAELQERARKLSGLTIEGTLSDLHVQHLPRVPSFVPLLPYVKLRVIIASGPDYRMVCFSSAMKQSTERIFGRLSEMSILKGVYINIFLPPGCAARRPDGTDGVAHLEEGLSCLVDNDRVRTIHVYAPAKRPDLKQLTPAWRAESILGSENLILCYTSEMNGLQRGE